MYHVEMKSLSGGKMCAGAGEMSCQGFISKLKRPSLFTLNPECDQASAKHCMTIFTCNLLYHLEGKFYPN